MKLVVRVAFLAIGWFQVLHAWNLEEGECGDLTWEHLERIRRTLTTFGLVNVAVGQKEVGELAHAHWGDLVHELSPAMTRMEMMPLTNNSLCTVALASARLLVKPWQYLPRLDRWISPDWLFRQLRWDKLVAAGWGGFFAMLARQVPEKKVNETEMPEFANMYLRSPLQGAKYTPLQWTRVAQRFAIEWHLRVCKGCWIGEALLIGRPHPIFRQLWTFSAQLEQAARKRRALPSQQNLFHPRWPHIASAALLDAKVGLKCAGNGLDPHRRGVQLSCQRWELFPASPFTGDFRSLLEPQATEPDLLPTAAVCITGPLRAEHQTRGLHSIGKHLVKAMSADLFLFVPMPPAMTSQETMYEAAIAMSAELGPIRTLLMAEEWRMVELAIALGGPQFEKRYVSFHGNWRAPLFEETGGNLQMLFQQAACREMISAYEEQRGVQYKYITFSRIDFLWFADHPSIHRLEIPPSLKAAWIPRGDDWGTGINDRHAVLTRAASDLYLSRWHQILDGSAVKLLDALPQRSSGETMLRRQLLSSGIQVRRFSTIAFVLCCRPGPSCVHEAGIDRPLTRVEKTLCAKYPSESASVLTSVTSRGSYQPLSKSHWAKSPQWVWVQKRQPQFANLLIQGAEPLMGAGKLEKKEPEITNSSVAMDLHLECCLSQSGQVTCWTWIFRQRCQCLK